MSVPPNKGPHIISKDDLRFGDILLKYDRGFISRCIQKRIGSLYSHASIYLGAGRVAEAIPFPPIVTTARLKIPRTGHFAVFRTQNRANRELFPAQKQAIQQFIRRLRWRITFYDFRVIKMSWLTDIRQQRREYVENSLEKIAEYFNKGTVPDSRYKRTYHCSAFVAACYFEAQLLGESINAIEPPRLQLPEDLGADHYLFGHFVGYLARQAAYVVPEQDPFQNRYTYDDAEYP